MTNLPGYAQSLYDAVYCARDDMENRIKEQQLGLFADRTSAHEWWPNQFRLLLSSLAYILLESIRHTALRGAELETAQASTIRLKLLKIGGCYFTQYPSYSFPFIQPLSLSGFIHNSGRPPATRIDQTSAAPAR